MLKSSPFFKSVEGYQMIGSKNNIDNNHVLIFDEVDGMSSGDRGGNAQLLNFVRATSIPIICICNDSKSQKMRSLEQACAQIKFYKPNKSQIMSKIKEISKKECVKIDDNAINLIIEQNNSDIRACITNLEILAHSFRNQLITYDLVLTNGSKKDALSNTSFMDAAKTLLTGADFRNLTHREKVD